MLNPQLLHFEDPLKLDFEADVVDQLSLPEGKIGVVLDRTYFYPAGGGQAHDTGTLGEAQVIDVQKDEDLLPGLVQGRTIHLVDREVPLGPIIARIDRDRRFGHMQHHTAQHLLTQCLLRLFDLETVSAHISGESPSTLDLPYTALSRADLDRAEELANEIVWENRLVRAYFVTPDKVEQLPLRKTPKVTENIRVVEIDGYDWTPCGGTHCRSTGMIGLVKVLKIERQNEKGRVSFVAGRQALVQFRELYTITSELAGEMSVGPRDLPAAVSRQTVSLRTAQKELQALRQERLQWEAHDLVDTAEAFDQIRLVLSGFENRPVQELRALAELLKVEAGLITVLASAAEGKLALVVACGAGSGMSARDLLVDLLRPFGGRGGGDTALAQGGSPLPPGGLPAFLASVRQAIAQ